MRAIVLPLIASLLLTGCESTSFDPAPIAGLVVPYSAEFQERAADELAALPDGSALAVMIGDYARLRAQLRAGKI